MLGEILRAVLVLGTLAAWIAAFTGVLIYADGQAAAAEDEEV